MRHWPQLLVKNFASLRACFLVLLLTARPATAEAARASFASPCPQTGTDRALVAHIDERLEITLKDGRILRLAGLEPARPTPDAPDFPAAARDAFAARIHGALSFLSLADRPDRWGRLPVFAFFESSQTGDPAISAGKFLLAGGFARFMPEPEAHTCRDDFLAAEATAREAKLGLWRDPYYAIIAATDRPAFAEKTATNVIVAGRLFAVDKGAMRTYLEFTPPGGRGFSVTFVKRNDKIFERAGMNFHALIGRALRVRGLLDLRFGPQIEISSPDQIELIPAGEGAPGMNQNSAAEPAVVSTKAR